ncbi:hypothetical protein JW758_02040 [Candidatus Peregrinibacteria bacterium]|nr:hypothetical protein [Candidatus Peregrinibacteria bacterium]
MKNKTISNDTQLQLNFDKLFVEDKNTTLPSNKVVSFSDLQNKKKKFERNEATQRIISLSNHLYE